MERDLKTETGVRYLLGTETINIINDQQFLGWMVTSDWLFDHLKDEEHQIDEMYSK